MQTQFSCNPDGSLTFTLTVPNPNAGTLLELYSQTSGVTVQPPGQQAVSGNPVTTTWTINRSQIGFPFTVNLSTPGAGKIPGSDLCCFGFMNVHLPLCPPPRVAACPPSMVRNATAPGCSCPAGTALRGKACVPGVVAACRPPMVMNAAGACGCPEGTTLRGKACVRRLMCTAPMVANRAGTQCVCAPGLVQRGRECIRIAGPDLPHLRGLGIGPGRPMREQTPRGPLR
jgi:hypothetical protein